MISYKGLWFIYLRIDLNNIKRFLTLKMLISEPAKYVYAAAFNIDLQ